MDTRLKGTSVLDQLLQLRLTILNRMRRAILRRPSRILTNTLLALLLFDNARSLLLLAAVQRSSRVVHAVQHLIAILSRTPVNNDTYDSNHANDLQHLHFDYFPFAPSGCTREKKRARCLLNVLKLHFVSSPRFR